jgi:hypothetical protein
MIRKPRTNKAQMEKIGGFFPALAGILPLLPALAAGASALAGLTQTAKNTRDLIKGKGAKGGSMRLNYDKTKSKSGGSMRLNHDKKKKSGGSMRLNHDKTKKKHGGMIMEKTKQSKKSKKSKKRGKGIKPQGYVPTGNGMVPHGKMTKSRLFF